MVVQIMAEAYDEVGMCPYFTQLPVRVKQPWLMQIVGVEFPGFEVLLPGFDAPDPGLLVPAPGFEELLPGFDVPEPGFEVPAEGFEVLLPGFEVPVPGFEVPLPVFDVPGFVPQAQRWMTQVGQAMVKVPPNVRIVLAESPDCMAQSGRLKTSCSFSDCQIALARIQTMTLLQCFTFELHATCVCT